MKRHDHGWWRRWRFQLSGLILILPGWFFWQGMNPSFPDPWAEQTLGDFSATPTPADNAPPYSHDGQWQKDFSVRFCQGCTDHFRTAWLSTGDAPRPLDDDLHGVLHGHGDMLHAHVPWPRQAAAGERLWLQVENWRGERWTASWPIPAAGTASGP